MSVLKYFEPFKKENWEKKGVLNDDDDAKDCDYKQDDDPEHKDKQDYNGNITIIKIMMRSMSMLDTCPILCEAYLYCFRETELDKPDKARK